MFAARNSATVATTVADSLFWSLRSQMKAGKMKLVGTTLQPDLRKVDPV